MHPLATSSRLENALRLLDHRLWQVPAVAYLYKHPDDGEQALKFFQMLERLAYAWRHLLAPVEVSVVGLAYCWIILSWGQPVVGFACQGVGQLGGL